MPIGTKVTTSPPDVDIEVSDGGGGGGSGGKGGGPRYIDIHVSWTHSRLRFLSVQDKGHECKRGTALAHWHRVRCAAGGKKKVRLRLSRKSAGTAYVVVCAMDTVNGDRKSTKKLFP